MIGDDLGQEGAGGVGEGDFVGHERAPERCERPLRGQRGRQFRPASNGRSGAELEEAQLVRAVTDQQVLGLLIVVQHHAVVLASDARLLVAAEGRVGGVGVVAVGPDSTGLDAATKAVGAVDIAGPDSGAEAVEGVVGDL